MSSEWECIVVGGGAAGLSAALVLGRARRRTLLLDGGGQSNLAAAAVGGLLGHDGRPPAELYAEGRREVTAYPSVELRELEAIGGKREGEGFALELADGSVERARTVLLATGMDYSYPDIPGAAERWGGSVFHCPFCHGWEVRDRELAVVGADEAGLHRVLLLRGWSDRLTLLSGGAELPAGGAERLARAGVEVDEREVAGLRGPGRELEAVVFADGSERPCGGLLLPVTLSWRSPLPEQLGARRAAPSPLGTDSIEVDRVGGAGSLRCRRSAAWAAVGVGLGCVGVVGGVRGGQCVDRGLSRPVGRDARPKGREGGSPGCLPRAETQSLRACFLSARGRHPDTPRTLESNSARRPRDELHPPWLKLQASADGSGERRSTANPQPSYPRSAVT